MSTSSTATRAADTGPRTGSTALASRSALLRLLSRPGAGVLVFLVVLLVAMEATIPVFLAPGNLYVIANQTVFVLLPTLGMTLVIIAGGIDLSVGSTLGVCGGVAGALAASGMPLAVALGAALLAGAAIGAINGLLVTLLAIPDFIATLAMLGVLRGALYVWTQGVPILDYASPTFTMIGGLRPLFWPATVPTIAALSVLVALAFLLRRTRAGMYLRATGSSAEAASLSGVSVARVKVLSYVGSGVLAAVAGILLAGRLTTVHPDMGAGYELQAVAAAVMGGAVLSGGRGSFWGALIGAITLTVIQNVLNILNLNSNWQDVLVGTIIISAVMLDRAALRLSTR